LLLSRPILFIISIVIFILSVILNITSKEVYSCIIAIFSVIILVIFWFLPVDTIRQALTQDIINKYYCGDDTRLSKGTKILGGIQLISNSVDEINNYVFVNDSHCLITVCAEELYYCNYDKPIILD